MTQLQTKTKSAKGGELKKTAGMRTGESAAGAQKAIGKALESGALTKPQNMFNELSESDKQKANDRLALAFDLFREVIKLNAITMQAGHTSKDGREYYLLAFENVTRCGNASCGYIHLKGMNCPHCGSKPMPRAKNEK